MGGGGKVVAEEFGNNINNALTLEKVNAEREREREREKEKERRLKNHRKRERGTVIFYTIIYSSVMPTPSSVHYQWGGHTASIALV